MSHPVTSPLQRNQLDGMWTVWEEGYVKTTSKKSETEHSPTCEFCWPYFQRAISPHPPNPTTTIHHHPHPYHRLSRNRPATCPCRLPSTCTWTRTPRRRGVCSKTRDPLWQVRTPSVDCRNRVGTVPEYI